MERIGTVLAVCNRHGSTNHVIFVVYDAEGDHRIEECSACLQEFLGGDLS